MRRSLRAVSAALLGGVLMAVLVPPAAAAAGSEWREVFAPDGSITQKLIPRQPAAVPFSGQVTATVVPIQQTGPSDKRFDLVFVGDGYTAAETAKYHEHVVSKWEELTKVEPFKTLKSSFNVWQVNVVSAQSGVDGDPTQGVRKNTALDMGFWCGGTERLLCVNEAKARQFAASAPAVDQIVALGNTTKYGGAGGGVATSAGGNAQAGQIVVHELGHSVGGLADEYDYPNDLYTGSEPREVNVSKYTSAQMQQSKTKWYQYLGKASPDGGVIGTVEGGYYHKRGVYRPTTNSLMRSLGRPFNLIGLDVMTAAIKRKTG